MTTAKLKSEKNCVVLGALEGGRFAKALSALGLELGRLEAFVADLSDSVDVAPEPVHSIGYEVDRDAVLVDYLDRSLANAISQLIGLRVMTRTAGAALERAGGDNTSVIGQTIVL
jgi:hypothetical protein